MARVIFTPNIQRHIGCPETDAKGDTVGAVLDSVFAQNPRARAYVLDDQSRLRTHMLVFIDDQIIRDRRGLTDAVADDSTIYVFQALSGG